LKGFVQENIIRSATGKQLVHDPAVPFVVAVAGHRDLHPDDVAVVQTRIREVIALINSTVPSTAIYFMSALADGADQLFAAEVFDLKRSLGPDGDRIRLFVPLPMALDKYLIEQAGGAVAQTEDPKAFDKAHAAFTERFSRYAKMADNVFPIPEFPLDIKAARLARSDNKPYARLARYLNIHAHVLIAVWDGQTAPTERFPRQAGGTLDAVLSRLEGFDRINESRSGRRFAEPDCGSVIHIYTRRAGASSRDLLPATEQRHGVCLISEKTSDRSSERRDQRPKYFASPIQAAEGFVARKNWARLVPNCEHVLGRRFDTATLGILQHVWETSLEIKTLNSTHRGYLQSRWKGRAERYAAALIQSENHYLESLFGGISKTVNAVDNRDAEQSFQRTCADLAPLVHTYSVADVLAIRAHRRWSTRWLFIACGAMIAGASSSLKVIDLAHGQLIETLAFSGGAAVAFLVYLEFTLSINRNAYLEYRALAEGLRFQMYWLAAGKTTLVTDYYVQKYRKDIGWIRRALDACIVIQSVHALSAVSVARGWIVSQLEYLGGKAEARRRELNSRATTWGNNLLLIGLVCGLGGAAIAILGHGSTVLTLTLLVAGMKLAAAAGAAWLSYNGKMAHAETLRQFEQLKGVYSRALTALDEIEKKEKPEQQARDLLLALGKEALAENATWLVNNQQRKVTWTGR
jgi:hypothetical protein